MLKKYHLKIALYLPMVRQVRHIRFSFKYVFFSVTHIQVNQIYQISKKSLNIDRFYIQVHLKIAVH